jgi:hypothetical protein
VPASACISGVTSSAGSIPGGNIILKRRANSLLFGQSCASATRSMTLPAICGAAFTNAIICSAASARLVSDAGPTLTVTLYFPIVTSEFGSIGSLIF